MDNIIAAMESGHLHLSTQKSFYVEISRARNRAELVTDSREGLREHLESAGGSIPIAGQSGRALMRWGISVPSEVVLEQPANDPGFAASGFGAFLGLEADYLLLDQAHFAAIAHRQTEPSGADQAANAVTRLAIFLHHPVGEFLRTLLLSLPSGRAA